MTRAEAIAALDLAEKACDAAAVAFSCASRRVDRSRSEKNRRAYIDASQTLDEAVIACSEARDAIGVAERREHRQAMQAARAALEARQPSLFA